MISGPRGSQRTFTLFPSTTLCRYKRGPIRHFNDSDDWSTATPGPIVELIEIFCRYATLAVAGLALTRSMSSACRLSFSLSASKSALPIVQWRSEAHTSELQSLMRISYAVFCFKKKNQKKQ